MQGDRHSVLTGCMIIFEMRVNPSLFIKSSIYTCRIDICQTIKHIHPKKSGPIDLLRSYMKRIFKLLESSYAVSGTTLLLSMIKVLHYLVVLQVLLS